MPFFILLRLLLQIVLLILLILLSLLLGLHLHSPFVHLAVGLGGIVIFIPSYLSDITPRYTV